MSREMDLLKHAIASRQSFTEVLKLDMEEANTPQERNEGLTNSDQNTAMTFKDSSGSFTTKNMSHSLNITKQDSSGDIVQSYRAVPPGIEKLPMGDDVGEVIETPATYKEPTINNWFLKQKKNG